MRGCNHAHNRQSGLSRVRGCARTAITLGAATIGASGLAAAPAAALQAGCTQSGTAVTCTYGPSFTPWTVPPGVTSLHVVAIGGNGAGGQGLNGVAGGLGGLGAIVSGDLAVTPGTALDAVVGGNGYKWSGGPWGGGGDGGTHADGGGGAETDVRLASTGTKLIVAAGGGGGGAATGLGPGANGGSAGQRGSLSTCFGGTGCSGDAGTASGPGGGGSGGVAPTTLPGCNGHDGYTFGPGGGGGTGTSCNPGGGGGGGGLYGGGGGGAGATSSGISFPNGGGGGGSSLVPPGGSSGLRQLNYTVVPAETITYKSPCYQAQLLGNPGFENGFNAAPWSATAGVISNGGEPPHSGAWDAWLDGYGTTHTDTLSQPITIPAACTDSTLSFWLHIDTAETGTYPYDTLKVNVIDAAGAHTIAQYSNADAAGGYVRRSMSLAQFAGEPVTIQFVGSEDYSNETSFVIDDTALVTAGG
jgi:hypothetical protein